MRINLRETNTKHISSPNNVTAMNSLGSKVAATVIIGVGWLAFIVLYLAFFAGNFDFWQKLAILIASGAIACGIVALMWIKWALK
ncbi:MAG: hypothetical protein K6T73_02970 [Candidatus Bathyarchaeota archaeon]|nr:hypothetical protein [Candidatus Bathyarchaeota archaeon]